MGISVIIPLYNKVATVGRAVDSALRQDVDIEIVVVDDGSTDGSGKIVKGYGDRLRYIRQDNEGPSAARNCGVQASRFPILVFLDADDELLPGCLSAHIACRQSWPDVQLSLSPSCSIKKIIENQPQEFIHVDGFYYTKRFDVKMIAGMPVDGICVDRDLFEKVGGFDKQLRCWEVTDLMYRLSLESPVIGILDRTYVKVHKNIDNSQFKKAKNDIIFRRRYILNILNILSKFPYDQKKAILDNIRKKLKYLIVSGALRDYKSIFMQMNNRMIIFNFIDLYILSMFSNAMIKRIIRIWNLSKKMFKVFY